MNGHLSCMHGLESLGPDDGWLFGLGRWRILTLDKLKRKVLGF